MQLKPFHTIKLSKPVDIFYGEGIALKQLHEIIKSKTLNNNVVVVTDDNLIELYGNELEKYLLKNGFNTAFAVIKAGEKSKNINTVLELYKFLNQTGLSRKDIIIAMGGGVVGDITGFVAATYMRGIPYIQLPTTLLAMIDSSIGGKTGIDLPYGKNLAGAFYQPEAIVTDPEFLRTLPDAVVNDGIAEAIKYGLIYDKEIFDTLGKDYDDKALRKIIESSVIIKSKIVEEDEKESGLRMILNFGHTFGHAIEKSMNFQGIMHGAAVGIGMVIASKIGEQMGITPQGTYLKIKEVLEKHGLPTMTAVKKKDIFKAICSDKKRDCDNINLVLLKDIGKAVTEKISIQELSEKNYE